LFDAESLASFVVAAKRRRAIGSHALDHGDAHQRWHAHRHSSGTGPVYQGRFKSFPVQTDEHFITVARYVERNALRAKLVKRAEEWRWSSLFQFKQNGAAGFDFVTDWPMERPQNWIEFVNAPDNASALDDLRTIIVCSEADRLVVQIG
jgi:putative transposase